MLDPRPVWRRLWSGYLTGFIWLLGIYILWLGPPFYSYAGRMRHFGLLNVMEVLEPQYGEYMYYEVEFWLNGKVHPAAVAVTSALTIALTWWCVARHSAWVERRSMRCLPLSKRKRRIAQGRCPKCGYNLSGNESGVCPECGAER